MKIAVAFVLLAGLGLALDTASCASKNTCGASAGAGGSGGSGGTAGSGGSSDCSTSSTAGSAGAPTTCDALTGLQACLTSFCAGSGASTPFCVCYLRGFDLAGSNSTDPSTDCTCTAFNPAAFCQQALQNGYTAANYTDCGAVTSPLISMCVGVQ